MEFCKKLIAAAGLTLSVAVGLWAQDLSPRAYLITPVHANALNVTYSYFNGELQFDGAVPITGATAEASVPIISFYHAFNFFGRSANFTVAVPYGVGSFQGIVLDVPKSTHLSGLLDSVYRFSVNLKGGPAMQSAEFMKWHQTLLIGVSLKIVAPTGKYDSTKLINWGSNRWAFKPEMGISRRWGHLVLDAYGGVWFFTTNREFFSHNSLFPGAESQSQKPIGTLEGHLSYDFKPRLWVSLDANFWYGGLTSLNGAENPNTIQQNSRIGATTSIPLANHQSLKLSYDYGAYTKFGGAYNNVSFGWQYSWLGWPK